MDPAGTMQLKWWQGVLIALASGLCVAAARLPEGLPTTVALGCCVLWALPLLVGRCPWALAALLPALALFDTGWTGLVGWTLAAGLVPLPLVDWHRRRQREELRPLRNELRDSEREVDILSRQVQRYPQLLEASLQLASARDVDQFAEQLRDAVQQLLDEVTSVQVFVDTGHGLELRAAQIEAGAHADDKFRDLIAYVAAQRRQYIHRRPASIIAVHPLWTGSSEQLSDKPDQYQGVFAVEFASGGLEDHLIIDLVASLGQIAGMALASIHLLDEARALALHDDLTGLLGQHEFLRRLDEQIAVVRRQEDRLGVIMCDMDHLKRFNDRYGHAVGDQALRAVGEVVRRLCPEPAIACRYGGEEFAVLLPFTRGGKVQRLAHELHASIRSLVLDADDPGRTVTASLGWAVLHDDEQSWDLLQRADEACYRAKAAGRDRVESGEEPGQGDGSGPDRPLVLADAGEPSATASNGEQPAPGEPEAGPAPEADER